ncbi:MAG TPA: AbrB/MazE/SpoVT family DNA-binding domain-containing protein [Solirubrobacteraceae bacterium]|nr:AbrB/MazE/SpoVT family DNA-binding domain-containing protein [Solirubrobacteraceae bacterium]
MPSISTKNQVTIPVRSLQEAGLHPGDQVLAEAVDDGKLRIRRGARSFEAAFGALTTVYPPGYFKRLDAEDERR